MVLCHLSGAVCHEVAPPKMDGFYIEAMRITTPVGVGDEALATKVHQTILVAI